MNDPDRSVTRKKVLSMLQAKSASERKRAVAVWLRLKERDAAAAESIIPAAIAMIQREKLADVRRAMLACLTRFEGYSQERMRLFIDVLDDQNRETKRFAIVTVASLFRKEAAAAWPRLAQLMRSESEDLSVRQAATAALGYCSDSQTEPACLQILKLTLRSPDLALSALDGLGALGPAAATVAPLLKALLDEAILKAKSAKTRQALEGATTWITLTTDTLTRIGPSAALVCPALVMEGIFAELPRSHFANKLSAMSYGRLLAACGAAVLQFSSPLHGPKGQEL